MQYPVPISQVGGYTGYINTVLPQLSIARGSSWHQSTDSWVASRTPIISLTETLLLVAYSQYFNISWFYICYNNYNRSSDDD